MAVIGTAGHVDHGKSTLIEALTGRDPDRWAEEKARGLTIDLGFAWTTLPGGSEVSFVDVPGHEHFIKNMLAGIEAVDVALLVVAADEGWMPQTEEHVAILDLLAVSRAVVALTKVDRVDGDLADLAALEVEERLAGTSLEGSAIIRVAAIEGRGLEDLRGELARLVDTVPPPLDGRPRLWVDRSFTVEGAGTVVTGTLVSGRVAVGDRLTLWPTTREARVRGLQSHERDHETVSAGRRVAINLVGVDRGEVERGAMLGAASDWAPSGRVAALLRPARYVEEPTDRGAYHLHVGSGAWPVRLRLVEPDLALMELRTPLPLAVGDRFIVRDTGRRLVVAGGRILDPAPPRRARDVRLTRRTLEAAIDGPPGETADALLAVRGTERLSVLAAHSGGGRPSGALLGSVVASPDHLAGLTDRLVATVADFHARNPMRAGIPLATAAAALGVAGEAIATLAAASRGRVEVAGTTLRSAGFREGRSVADENAWQAAVERLEAAGLAVPRVSELGLDTELVYALTREGSLVGVSTDFVYLPSQIAELTEVLMSMGDGFTVSEFRDRTGLSRKYAVPLLEWADASGLTVRMGDTRRIRGRAGP
jgi:selenocysteine-specific elongation factor